ncbi:tape measure protein [Lactococcus lactis]|uniref:tape measure protein n=1 Tax=Lactococcus lactis TaxID=1358 RepID=UPI003981B762
MESYSVEAVLSAVDKNFTSTMNNANSSMGGLDKSSQNTNTSILDIAKGVGIFKLVDSAVGVVRNSLDGAINRFDTLNKYPVVMQALGYSASDVDKSMAKLNKGIDGLPTSLNEIVSNTQQLAISTGSLTKGTDTAIALNNAFLASGASTADASRGMQQYVQMLSKGTVDIQSWRTLQETMPIAMDKVAKSFKDKGVNSVSELYGALQSGKITFDHFNSRLIKLNGGVGGFAELAKKNSAGIKTSFSNVQTAIVKGLANVLSAIDSGMKSAGLGSIAQNFDKLKTVVNQVFGAITKAIPPVISVIARIIATFKTLFEFVNQNKDWIAPLVAGITAGIAAYNLWKGAINAWNTVTKIATGVQAAFNAVMDANPIMLIVIAIAAVVAGLVYFFTQTKTGQEIWSNFVKFLSSAWQSLVKVSKDVWDNITKAWDSAVKWFSDTWSSIKKGAKGLWDGTIQGAKDAVDSVKNAWNSTKEWFANLWKGTTSGLASAWDSVTTTLAPFVETIKSIFQPILNFFSGLWGQVQTIFSSAWEIIKTVVMGPILLLIDLITGNFNQFKADIIMLWQTLFTNAVTLITTYVQIIVGLFTAWGQTVSNIWTTVVNTVQSLWGAFTTWVVNMANSIVNGIVNGWNSFKQGTINLWNATIQWIKNTWASFVQWVINSANAIVNGVKQGWESLKQGTINLWNGMINGLKGIWDGLKQGVRSLIADVVNIFNTLKNVNLLDIGQAIIDGFVKGLKQKWEDGMKFIGGIGDWIREHKGPIRKDRKLLTPAGNAIMNGLNAGLTGGFRNVQSNVSGMGDMIASAINSDYSVDIGANVAAANRSISSQISHDVNLNQGKQPALFNVRLGNQNFKAFVDDISNAQGQEINLNMGF